MTTYSGTLTGTGNFSGLGGTAVFTEKDVETENITIAANGDYTGTLQQNITLTATITVAGLTTTQTVTQQSTSPVSGNVNLPASEPQTLFGQTVTYTSNFANNNSEIVTNFSHSENFMGFTGTWTFGGTLVIRDLLEQGDNIVIPGFKLPGTGSLGITFNDTGTNGLTLDFLVLSGRTHVSIDSIGATGGFNVLPQLEDKHNNLTKVTISGSEAFSLGGGTHQSNSGDGVVTDIAATATSPTVVPSSLTLIDASATTGGVTIFAGATNTNGTGSFQNGGNLNPNVTITYTGLTIKGGSGSDVIENDAKLGIVTDGNGNDVNVTLGGAGAQAVLGTGTNDKVFVGVSHLGTTETAGSALGDSVNFGFAAMAGLVVGIGAEAGSTAGTTSIGRTKVLNAADGMKIDFTAITTSSNIADETTAVASSATLATAGTVQTSHQRPRFRPSASAAPAAWRCSRHRPPTRTALPGSPENRYDVLQMEPSNDLKPPSAFGADPVERIFKATRAYLDAPSGGDVKMHIGFSERMEPAVMVCIHGMDYALLYKEALIVADILEHVRKQAKLEGGSIDSMIHGLRVSAEGARKNMAG